MKNASPASEVHSVLFGEKLARVRQKLISWEHTPNRRPILIHINITFDDISNLPTPPGPMELLECAEKMGGHPDTDYIFLSDDYIKVFLCPTEASLSVGDMSQREIIDWFWEHCDITKLEFEKFDDNTCEIFDCVENLRHWLKVENWEALSDFLINQDSSALYLRKVIEWLNNGKKDAYQSLMTSLSKQDTNPVCRWLLLLCCRWSVPLLRNMPENSIDFQLLSSLWEKPEQARDATLSQIAAMVRRLALT